MTMHRSGKTCPRPGFVLACKCGDSSPKDHDAVVEVERMCSSLSLRNIWAASQSLWAHRVLVGQDFPLRK